MVNKLQRKKRVVVKLSDKRPEQVTAKGGQVVVEMLANRMRLWSGCRRLVAARRDPGQGFEPTAMIGALVHGLLGGGKGFSATEPMRGDEPLLRLVGLDRAPSAETVEEIVKYLGEHQDGHEGLLQVLEQLCVRLQESEKRSELMSQDGFVPVWSDGSLLEVTGKDFEALKEIKGRLGQLLVGLFVGPYLASCDFCGQGEGEGEESVVRRLMPRAMVNVVDKLKVRHDVLVLLDSLHGDGPTLDLLESDACAPARYIVGANKLVETHTVLSQVGESEWFPSVHYDKRRWECSAVCVSWIQCVGWSRKRLLVGRRWKKRGEFLWHYAGVITNVELDAPRILAKMKREEINYAEAIWGLYDYKQAMENQWKDKLIDMGLHHPPSAKVRANAIFYVIAGLAYNLSVGLRRLGLSGPERKMRLWRLRREVFDVAVRVASSGRYLIAYALDARDYVFARLQQMMLRLSLL
jgi:hypothetical protein